MTKRSSNRIYRSRSFSKALAGHREYTEGETAFAANETP